MPIDTSKTALRGYVNLDYIVSLVLMDLKDDHTINEKIILQYTILGFTELNLYTSPKIKIEYRPISAAKTIDIPDDMMEYIKMGVSINGKMWTFTELDEIIMPRNTDACGTTLETVSDCNGTQASSDFFSPVNNLTGNWGYYFAQHYRHGQFVGELYGTRGSNFVNFRVDWDRRQIAFTGIGDDVEHVILEYVSTNIGNDGSAIVERKAVQALRSYVHYELAANDKRATESKIARLWDKYTMHYDKLLIYDTLPHTVDDYKDYMYREVSLNPRR